MTTLHDRLADLADEAPPGGPVPGLWADGVRRQRRRRTGTAVIVVAVVLALGALGVVDWTTSRTPGPADNDVVPGLMRLPDRFYEPTSRLPGTEDHPIGPVVAMLGGDRAGQAANGLAVVSGVTGEYRYLDLPDKVGDGYLSLDGTRLAYWYGVHDLSGPYDNRIDGLAVYDTVTGAIVRHRVESTHGIQPDGATWVGDRIWFGYRTYAGAERRSSEGLQQVVWDPESQESTSSSRGPVPAFNVSYGNNGVLAEAAGRRLRLWSARDLSVTARFRIDRSVDGPAWTSPTAARSVVMADPDGQASSDSGREAAVLVMETAGPGEAITTPIPGVLAIGVLGWRDEDHVVVLNRDSSYSSVDVDTGATESLVTVDPGASWDPRLQVATMAWSAPTFAAPAPPNALSRLLIAEIAVFVVVLGLASILLWRRRVRP